MRNAKIIATVGPACKTKEVLTNMVKAGVNAFRFNMSHGDYASHGEQIELVKEIRESLGLSLPIIVDTKGPEIRIGTFENGGVTLSEGSVFILTTQPVIGDNRRVSVTYPKLPEIVKEGSVILVNDGMTELSVIKTTGSEVYTKVIFGGELKNNKSINIPGAKLDLPYLSLNDKKDINFALTNGAEYLAISFVSCAKDVLQVRDYAIKLGDNGVKIISKIESQAGIDNIDEIINASDGIMVARGDMGVEIPFEKIPQMQKMIINKCKNAGKLVIVATEMLESMTTNIRPTRAEISDVANAVLDGADAVMLSGETSVGRDPARVVSVMDKIVRECEQSAKFNADLANINNKTTSITGGVALSACVLAQTSNAKAIIAVTKTGSTAIEVSRFRPTTMIIGCTPVERTFMQLGLVWGVMPMMQNEISSTEKLLEDARNCARYSGLVNLGDIVVQTAGQDSTSSNMVIINKV